MKIKLYGLTVFVLLAAATGYGGEKQSVVAPGAQVIKLAGGFSFTEGPASDAVGNVFFTDIPNNRIHKWSLDGKLTIFRKNSGGANGLFFDKKGNLLACEGGGRRLVSINPKGKVEVLAEEYRGKKFNSLNDLWIDPKGGIYFTDPRYGRRDDMQQDGEHVYYLSPNRKEIKRVIDDMVRPNGVIGTPDGKILYVTDHGGSKTFRYTINQDGTLSNKKLFAPQGSDGMTIDNQGNVYLTRGGVTVYNKNGEKIEVIKVPEGPANVCFGGKNKSTLFITARTSLYSVRMRVSGVEQQSTTDLRNGMMQVESGEEGENGTSDINEKITQICTGPADFNDVIKIFGQPSGYDYRRQSFKLGDLPVERYWIRYPDSINIFMRRDKVDFLEIIDSAYIHNGKIPMGSSLESVLNKVGQPKETVVGQRGWEDGVLYKDIEGRVGWCQYRREDLNADFRFLNYSLGCVHILEIKSGEDGENGTSDINGKVAQICTGPADFNDVIKIFGQPSDYKWGRQSFKLEDLPVKSYWVWYPDSIHIFMKWDQADRLEIVDSAYVFNDKIPMGSSLEHVLSIVGQPKETVVGRRGSEDGVLYKDINGRVGWCQYKREDLNADFRFINYTLRCVSIFLESNSSATTSRTAKRSNSQIVTELGFEQDIIHTSTGELKIIFIGHGTLMFEFNGKIIHVDPVSREADYTKMPKADFILITHGHGDHLDNKAINILKKEGTKIILTKACAKRVTGGIVMQNGDKRNIQDLKIEAVPAYNIVHKRSNGIPFHPKGEGNGYVITLGDKRVYVAGDTENVPEMKRLKKIDIAFLPMNLPYTMTPEMAADAAKAFKPKILYPYHYGQTDPNKLVNLLKNSKAIKVRIRKMR
ncbi:MAG: SMP-30/gluconolactonase/LRE family protein [Planctomycetota bacterium]